MNDATIEPARADDFLPIAALDRIAWPERPEVFIPDGEHVWRVWCEYANVLVARLPQAVLIETGRVAGALVVFPTQQGENFLHKIMVHPAVRGSGLGTRLLAAALQRATAPVLLTVDPANDAAIALYRRHGFAVRAEVRGYYRPHEDRYVMVHPGTGGTASGAS